MNAEIESLLNGSIDLHVHSGPETKSRRMDAMETARYAYEAGMAGFALKSNEYLTTPLTYTLSQIYPGLEIYGSISLNSAVGGINPEAVLKAAQLGTSFVWMPTASANFLVSKTQPEKGIRILDTEGKLTAETIEVLNIVKSYNMTLMSGCISPTETIELFTSAKALGLEKLVANHPENFLDEQLEQLVNLGAYLEFSFLSCMPLTYKISPQELANNITKYGAKSCILTTSFGQYMNPPPSEGMRMAIASLVESGMLKENISSLIKDNPNRLVN